MDRLYKNIDESERFKEYKNILDSHFPDAPVHAVSKENKWVDYDIYYKNNEKRLQVTLYANNKADIVSFGMGDKYHEKFLFTMGLSYSEFERRLLEIKDFLEGEE